ncbi:hypothetical protein D3C80_711440 [compost metagenome]
MASTTSGSGLFQSDFGWMPTSAPQPTDDMGWALVKISASGPMPTSRYCDQRPISCSRRFTSAAFSEPATRPFRLSPRTGARRTRISWARSGSPLACSSITRSSMLSAKVTPAALIACRSAGARSSPALPLRKSSRLPRLVKDEGSDSFPTRPSISSSADRVGARDERSRRCPFEKSTGLGPAAAFDHTRPTRSAFGASTGKTISDDRACRYAKKSSHVQTRASTLHVGCPTI